MIMQTTHHTGVQPVESAPERQQFRTREQELWETDRSTWVQELLEWPILGSVYREADSSPRRNGESSKANHNIRIKMHMISSNLQSKADIFVGSPRRKTRRPYCP